MDRFDVGSKVSLEIFSRASSHCGKYAATVISVHGRGDYTVQWMAGPYGRVSMRAHEHDGTRSKADLVAGALAPPPTPKPMENPVGLNFEALEKGARDHAILNERFLEMAAAMYICPNCKRELKGSMARVNVPGAKEGSLVDMARLLSATELRCPDKACGVVLVRTSPEKKPGLFFPPMGKRN